MRKAIFLHVAIASAIVVSANDGNDFVFSVVHAPNFDIETNTINAEASNKVGVRFIDSDHVHLLDNSNTADPLLYAGKISTTNSAYQYVTVDRDGQVIESEPFYRLIDNYSTRNEFYGREKTVGESKGDQLLPRAHFRYNEVDNDHVYKTDDSYHSIHPNNEIPTFHIKTSPSDIRLLHDRVLEDIGILANITRISSGNVESAENVKIELSGQTSRLFEKLSYSVHIDKEMNNVFNGYRRFKLRSCATDPSYLREKLYYDLLSASGMPAAKASYVRLFINEVPQGLYLIADNYKNPFLSNVFGKKDKKYKHGALYQGSMQENPLAVGILQQGASLSYFGSHAKDYVEASVNMSAYKVQELGHGVHIEDGLKSLVKFIGFIHSTEDYGHNKKDDKELMRKWNKVFDISLFLKHMVLEVLMGHNDGYMGAAHNYMLYEDPDQKGRFVWLASDLDQTLGSTLISRRFESPKSQFEQLDRFALLDRIARRPLMRQILKVDGFNKQFYQIFSDFYHSFYKSNDFGRYINYMKELIQQDVAWDQKLDKHRENNFRNNQTVFDNQLNQKVLQLPLGPDFYNRINKISFESAIDGKIVDHPSITSLVDWFEETSELLRQFVSSKKKSINK